MLHALNKYRPGRKKDMTTNLNVKAKPWNPSSSKRTSSSSTMTASTTELSSSSSFMDPLDEGPATFPQFLELNKELQRHIFSFLTDSPLEFTKPAGSSYTSTPTKTTTTTGTDSSLTTTLPLVSKEIRQWADSDEYWGPALRRRVEDKSCGIMWQNGLRRLLPMDYDDGSDGTTTTAGAEKIETVKSYWLQHRQLDLSYKQLYKKVMTTHMRFDAPIFIMPYPCQLREVYGLHLFEPRYRIMMRDLMEHSTSNPQQASAGGPIIPATTNGVIMPPYFIHAHRSTRLAPGGTAMLVEIVRCRVYEHGNADVQLDPVALVKLERIRVRANAGHLFYATASRLSGIGN